VEDSTREALDRLRRELALRGVTMMSPQESGEEVAAEGISQAHIRTIQRDDEEQAPANYEYRAARRWLFFAVLGLGFFALLPWLAPVFAAVGWWGLANPIYTIYMFVCHQLPERAPFIFGYQVAFCWRNVAIHTGLFGFGLLYFLSAMPLSGGPGARVAPFVKGVLARLPGAIPLWVYLLTLAPIALDGFSHMFGLRDNLFNNPDPTFGSFLIGSQFLSLNWLLRIATGLLAAFGTIWFALPRFDKYMAMAAAITHAPSKLQSWNEQYAQSE
jgi:uncharacterized membrane protein